MQEKSRIRKNSQEGKSAEVSQQLPAVLGVEVLVERGHGQLTRDLRKPQCCLSYSGRWTFRVQGILSVRYTFTSERQPLLVQEYTIVMARELQTLKRPENSPFLALDSLSVTLGYRLV